MYGRRLLIACLGAVLGVSIALACGPDFPWQLLDDRAGTLKATPANSFAFEAAHLAPRPKDRLKAVEGEDWIRPRRDALVEAEAVGLSTDQVGIVRRIREADTGDDAFEKGIVLPTSVRHYTAGAVDFHKGDVMRAAARFRAVLVLPDRERRARGTWAAYMLGRSYGLAGDLGKASEAFRLTRALAIKGAPDPLGLAVASYGEEAKLHLDLANSYLVQDDLPGSAWRKYGREIAAAVALYAEQAARGSRSGIESLRIVAVSLLNHEKKLLAAVGDPMVQRLVVAYALARVQDVPAWGERMDAAKKDQRVHVEPHPLVRRLVYAIEQHGLDHPAGADRLAALSYRLGDYYHAERLVGKATGPLASWVKAKLALQAGDLAAAAAAYAEASKAFPPSDDPRPIDEANARLLTGEAGVLALSRGQYVDALEHLYPVASTYWGDVAYIAERVLTVDELKRFIDAKVPAPSVTKTVQATGEDGREPEGEGNWLVRNPAAQLRDLLARRLVRDGRYQEAMAYFHAQEDGHFKDHEVRKHLADYAKALHDATTRWGKVNRAEAWYTAAVLARRSGMEMMGYEAAPDFFAAGGDFDFGLGQAKLGEAFVTDGERKRFAGSAAKPDLRLHYRFIAVDHATHAADLLPPRSQAFAAVLCKATGWMMSSRDKVSTDVSGKNDAGERVHQLYQRYLKQGPHVKWATHFGHNCPDPDFARAAHLARTQIFRDARRFGSRHRWPISLVFVVAVSAGIVWFVRRRPTVVG